MFRVERQVHGQDARLTGELRIILTRPLKVQSLPPLDCFRNLSWLATQNTIPYRSVCVREECIIRMKSSPA